MSNNLITSGIFNGGYFFEDENLNLSPTVNEKIKRNREGIPSFIKIGFSKMYLSTLYISELTSLTEINKGLNNKPYKVNKYKFVLNGIHVDDGICSFVIEEINGTIKVSEVLSGNDILNTKIEDKDIQLFEEEIIVIFSNFEMQISKSGRVEFYKK